MSVVSTVAGIVTKPLFDVVGKWIDRKRAKDTLKAKAKLAKQEDATNITLTDAEWEAAAASEQGGTWKDEFVTVVMTYPYWGLFMGCLILAIWDNPAVLEGTIAGIEAIEALGVNVGRLLEIVVYAAVGLKIWRKA